MIRTVLSCAFLLAATNFAPAKDASLAPEQEKLANQLVGQLSHPSFKVREAASAKLIQYGRAAEPVPVHCPMVLRSPGGGIPRFGCGFP